MNNSVLLWSIEKQYLVRRLGGHLLHRRDGEERHFVWDERPRGGQKKKVGFEGSYGSRRSEDFFSRLEG